MLVLILFALVKLSFAYPCIEHKSLGLLDCSRLDISIFPLHARRNWVKFLDLKRNNISSVNLSEIVTDFPNIERLDLRYNPLKCTKPFHASVYILSDCPHSNNTATTSVVYHGSISVSSPAASQASQVKTGKNHILVLAVLLPIGIIALGIVCLYFVQTRRRLPTFPTIS